MIKVNIPDAVMTSENNKQSEILMNESHERGHEGAECVEADGQFPANNQTSKRGNEDQSAEDNSRAYQSENDTAALKAKKKELKKEICALSCLMKDSAKSCMRLKRENKNLLRELKQKCRKDEISKLEAMNPDGNSQSLDDDEEHYRTSSDSSGEFNSSPDCYSDDEERDSDSMNIIANGKEMNKFCN
ncbi:hypothetical protein HAX54_009876 [Datura stramonium]|uniref:Uncharacterized protein n=1 Tax=Datura stramonium TaxID=4076 RepID=A0ABS8WXL7_DATST|nr:hypothetical protein [Datura stramonium]